MTRLLRSRLALSLLGLAGFVGACGNIADTTKTEATDEGVRERVAGYAHPDMSAVELALANPPSREELLANDKLAYDPDLLKVEKIRHGTDADYTDSAGNGVVEITDLRNASCTAQVINRWFLLTAAHCVLPEWNYYFIKFTNSAGQQFELTEGAGYAVLQTNWKFADTDSAIIYLPGTLPTCQGTLSHCSATQPDVPVHALFQWFVPGEPIVNDELYNMVGYGGIDDGASQAGVQRMGIIAWHSATFTEQDRGLRIVATWQDESMPRPCKGDSGGPLVTFVSDHVLHTGIVSTVSDAAGNVSCHWQQGIAWYTGLTQAQLMELAFVMSIISDDQGLPFNCGTSGESGSLRVFGCGN